MRDDDRDICCQKRLQLLAEVDRLRAEAIRYRDERDDAEGEAQNLGALLDGARRELARYRILHPLGL